MERKSRDNARPTYKEVSRAQISKSKAFVLSECSKGGYTLAQQMSVIDETTGRPVTVFLKGAIHISNIGTLEKISNMFQQALQRWKEDREAIDWDMREKDAR